ncbi:ABC transporter, permease protein [Selenomonas sp. oral taxon 892 str. F0426]|jgi:ABC superfamily ATP binding cassette transporter, permease protein|uniref:ABC transporter permease n=1 Tax=Selenomonas sp. oral taxon 892 TaxID=1321785 RepID=UPI0003AD62AD|nr:ABC transporter permease [Selenomonas sp. oral taxon 892]ERJ95951.1 ABC transporter, permease protein [Selenomonas sp. oral taxon 892 str. F0426]
MGKISLRMFVFGACLCIVLWAGLAYLLAMPVIPSPEQVALRLAAKFPETISVHAGYSLMRIVLGLFAAVAVGYPVGVLMGHFPRVNRLFAPVLYMTYPVPKIALLPVVMLLFGVGETSKLLLVFLIIVFQVIVGVRDAVAAIPSETYAPLRVLGASFPQIVRHIIVPASLPKFITAVRVAMATAISVLFFTETFGTQYGIGCYIMDAWLRVNYLDMYAGIVVLSTMGLMLFILLDFAERRLCAWNRQ